MAVNHVAPTVPMAPLPITKPRPQTAAAVIRMRRYTFSGYCLSVMPMMLSSWQLGKRYG